MQPRADALRGYRRRCRRVQRTVSASSLFCGASAARLNVDVCGRRQLGALLVFSRETKDLFARVFVDDVAGELAIAQRPISKIDHSSPERDAKHRRTRLKKSKCL